jgi:uncharacterized protein YodC (DUF2158 family)
MGIGLSHCYSITSGDTGTGIANCNWFKGFNNDRHSGPTNVFLSCTKGTSIFDPALIMPGVF